MQRVRIKLCGMTRPMDARLAGELGVDAIGVVLHADSPRRVEPGVAAEVFEAAGPFVSRVGLFKDAEVGLVRDRAAELALDYIQLHGPSAGPIDGLRCIVAVRDLRDVPGATVLLDPSEGTGRRAIWRELPPRTILAGGLTPGNVGEAIRVCRPWAVDVSSGIESAPGLKDRAKMRAFVHAVQDCHDR